jgi:hypothetical protein
MAHLLSYSSNGQMQDLALNFFAGDHADQYQDFPA